MSDEQIEYMDWLLRNTKIVFYLRFDGALYQIRSIGVDNEFDIEEPVFYCNGIDGCFACYNTDIRDVVVFPDIVVWPK